MPIQHRSSQHKPPRLTWLLQHLQTAITTLGQLWRQPLSTCLTTLVIAIAIALPSGFYLLIEHVHQTSQAWTTQASNISLYLEQQLSPLETQQIHRRVQQEPGVAETQLITKTQAMDEFRRLSGFGDALDLLEHNPLPAVILVQPTLNYQTPSTTEQLAARLQQWAAITHAQVDLQWLQRFAAITATATRGITLLAILLGVAVVLIIGNTIRLTIQNRQEAIRIMQQVGGTQAFIRRPFLYEGVWYGLFGALFALGLIFGTLALLQEPIQTLAEAYQTHIDLTTALNQHTLLSLSLSGPLLGLAGAWVAVRQHLSIAPT